MFSKFLKYLLVFLLIIFILFFFFFSNNFLIESKVSNLNQSDIMIDNFYKSIREKKISSQNKEDGVILSLISLLGLPRKGCLFSLL
jgi:hypothetical protein